MAAGWTGRVTLYGWFSGFEGDFFARERGVGTGVSLSKGDVLDKLETGVFATAELRRGRVGAIVDAAHIALGSGEDVVFPAPGVGPVPGRVSGDTTLTMVTLAGFYRAVEREGAAVDLYAGGRLVDADLSLQAAVAGGGPGVSAEAGETWVDPIVGVRGTVTLTDRIALTGLADIGGFGAGSDLAVNLYAGASVRVAGRVSAEAGLRYLKIDYAASRLAVDAELFGPIVGLSIGF